MTRGVIFAIVLAVLGTCLARSRTACAEEAAALVAYGRHLASECAACHSAEARAGSDSAGGIPVTVGGTTANPTFAPDLKAMAGDQLKNMIPGGKGNPLSGVFGNKKPY